MNIINDFSSKEKDAILTELFWDPEIRAKAEAYAKRMFVNLKQRQDKALEMFEMNHYDITNCKDNYNMLKKYLHYDPNIKIELDTDLLYVLGIDPDSEDYVELLRKINHRFYRDNQNKVLEDLIEMLIECNIFANN